ncbi:head-tail connector protein [[Clostridium] polysaccharolyticum]|uniref:Phage gp6-like head-tail connector protein n=1 Tax=[Clostridium] polysaccharolyticum TaxID=29364 RepID=A0A1H9YIA9_9FIRM|nr:hypothetical protein [[Clostridium] polysaccharolyticum]SES68726.1 hypothetical protein SAMN04487772_10233 [[Clostridium] polysaccharolyticum]
MNYLANESEETVEKVTDVVNACVAINSELNETLMQRLVLKLIKMQCEVVKADAFLLTELIESTETEIKTFCNRKDIPDGCIPIEIDMVCGYFYREKVSTGQQDGCISVKSITEGDTSTTFNTSKNTHDSLISSLIDEGRKRLCHFRKLRY